MNDPRHLKLANILVNYSTRVKPGDRVAIESTTLAEPVVRAVYELVLQRGAYPHLLFNFPDQDVLFFSYANDNQLDFTPTFQKLVTEQFDVYIRIRAEMNPRGLSGVPATRQARWQKAMSVVRNTMLKRASVGELRWVLTQLPTEGYAREAELSLPEYAEFLFKACHSDDDTPDPVAYWQGIAERQHGIIKHIEGRERVELKGPNVDLNLSIKDRSFVNCCGKVNLPDGEIFTGPVEDSVNGWVRYTYPAVYQGKIVEGIELTFEKGRVVNASAKTGEDLLLTMLDTDAGARYVGEFAIGTNFEINRFTRNILFDEKIGGSFHMALGTGYPETGSRNTSVIHWDMICDICQDTELRVDGDLIYKNGNFTVG